MPIALLQPPSLIDYIARGNSENLISSKSFTSARAKTEKLLSIVTVVFNGNDILEKTIRSVLQQDYSNIEYVIVDGGSNDGTLEIIKKYESQIKWISEPDRGISDAMNKGIALTRGSLIGIIHADDWYEENIFAQVMKLHVSNPIAIIHGNLRYWKGESPYYTAVANEKKMLEHMTIHHPTMFVPRSVYESTGLYRTDFKYAMDHEWAMRAKLHQCEFYYLQSVIANMMSDGVSDKNWLKAYRESALARSMLNLPTSFNIRITITSVVKTGIRRLLEIIGFKNVVGWYRNRFSLIKKSHLD